MEWLQSLLENAQFPIATAFVLGLMTAISPCPLATNITAVGYIGKDLENKRRVFYNGLIYTLGRATTYTVIGLIFFFGASQFKVSGFIQHWGERLLSPLLIIIGIFMLGLIRISILGLGRLTERMGKNLNKSYWDVFLLGIVFALAFCPYSGVLYFGMLIPITITSASGLFLPLVFAVATGLPVIFIAWLIAYSMTGVGKFYNNVKTFELWFRRVVAVVFILVGLYYAWVFYL